MLFAKRGRRRQPGPWPLAIWTAILFFNASCAGQVVLAWLGNAGWLKNALAVSVFLASLPLVIAAVWTVRRALRTRALRRLDYLDCPY